MRRRRRSRKKTLTECFAFSRVNASHKYEAATLSHSLSCCAHGAHTTHVILTTCSWSSFSSTLICMLQLCLRLSSAWFDAFYFSMQQPSFTCAANSIATTRKKKWSESCKSSTRCDGKENIAKWNKCFDVHVRAHIVAPPMVVQMRMGSLTIFAIR